MIWEIVGMFFALSPVIGTVVALWLWKRTEHSDYDALPTTELKYLWYCRYMANKEAVDRENYIKLLKRMDKYHGKTSIQAN